MAFNKPYELNEEQISSYLAESVRRLENMSDNDYKNLDKIKKLIKKNVPLTKRKYVFALLVRNAAFKFSPNPKFSRDVKNDRFNKNSRPAFNSKSHDENRTERPPRVTIEPSVANTIFVSVGRNRSVFPRDLITLLVNVAGLDRSRIGDIRVLASYSFVTLFAEDCDKVISILNGYEYRGRKLSVSFSSKKDELIKSEGLSEEETIPENVSNMGHADNSINRENESLAAEQNAFAQAMEDAPVEEISRAEPKKQEYVAPYSSTEDDGQVKSHFGDGAAY